MIFHERSYPGNQFTLPRPEIYFDSDEKLLIVATAWGAPSSAKKTIQTISEYFLSTRSDSEATSPFRRLEYLSPVANNLRISALVANELIFREQNKSEYHTGVELFAATTHEQEFTWIHIGQPNVLIKRKDQPALPLSVNLSLTSEVKVNNSSLPPLPTSLLGINIEPRIEAQSFRTHPGDALFLLSRSWIPAEFYKEEINSFELASRTLASSGSEPFWLGHLSLSQNKK